MSQTLLPAVLWTVILVQLVYLYGKTQNENINPKFRNRRSIPDDEKGKLFVGETYDYSGEYRIIRFYRSEGFQPGWNWDDVSLATQGSVNRLHYLDEIVKRWQGPISISVFAPGFDAAFADVAISMLRKCNADIEKFVHFHLVYPADFPADIVFKNDWTDMTCDEFKEALKNFESSFEGEDMVYPHNVLRNVARSGVNTEFLFLIDIDLVPNTSLREDFLKFATEKQLWNDNKIESEVHDLNVYVVPAFEIKSGNSSPGDKKELLAGVRAGNIRPFHNETCFNCHKAEDFNQWKESQNAKELEIAFTGAWNSNWEPFYIARRSIPMYDERFKGYGFDRIQQICELYVAGFSLHILNNAFVVHNGWKRLDQVAKEEDSFNWYLFNYHFKDELQRKYNTDKTCSPTEHGHDVDLNLPTILGPREGKALSDRPVNDDFNRYQIQQNQMGIPVAIKNEQPFSMEIVDPAVLGSLPAHDHRELVVVSRERHIRHYTGEELKKLYEKGLTLEGQMADFKEKDPNDLSWED